MSDFTNDEFLAALREAQGTQQRQGPRTFAEWQQEQALQKARGGGVQSSIAHYSPGFGMMGSNNAPNNAYMTGPPGNTTSRAPSGPRNRPSGNGGLGYKPPPSRQPYDGPSFSTQPWFGNVPGQQFGVQAGVQGAQPSKYDYTRPGQPPPWIDDVNMASIWYCYDSATEILTSHRGWQKFADLTDDDMVATMEPQTGRFVWQKPVDRPVLDYVGPLVTFNAAGVDLAVTPNHRMVVNYLPYGACERLGVPKQQGEGIYLIPADVLAATHNHHVKIPVTAKEWLAHDIPDMLLPSAKGENYDLLLRGRDYCAFMGLYLSEGSTSPGQVRIWQKHDSVHWQAMADILHRAFGSRASYIDHLGTRDDPGYFIIYSAALVEHVKQFGRTSFGKQIPLAIRNASKECLFAFLSAYMLGDGEFAEDQSAGGRGRTRTMRLPPAAIHGRITTISKDMADNLQEIAVKLGYSARIETLDRQELVGHKILHPDGSFNEVQSVSISYRVRIIGTELVGKLKSATVPYSGKVYCVCVPNNIVYVRRNGLAVWAGNSPFEPVWPFGPPYYTTPREWNFPVGYNLNYIPKRLELIGMLRGMRQSWGVLATIIETRKDQFLGLPWTIQVRGKPRKESKAVDEMRAFFRRPDGKLSYSQWTRKYLDDLFVTDAPTIFLDRNLDGKVRGAQILDGGTIFPLIDDVGRRPDTSYNIGPDGIVYEHRQPAFQQIIYGLPMVNLSEDEIIYGMMRPRPELPVFGYSPVEQILTEATEAIRKTFYQLEFWRAGSMPELMVTVPNVWTPRQIASFQAHFDALLSGQLTLKSKVRFIPGGMKPFDIKNASGESLWSQRDELLVRLACYAFSVSPTPFMHQTNRATANQVQFTATEEGLFPLMSYWKDDIIDSIIQEKFGYDDVEFVFQPRPEADQTKQATIHQIRLHDGAQTINEVRAELGLEPTPDGDFHLIYTGATVMRLDQIISGEAVAPGAPAPAKPPTAADPSSRSEVPVRGPARPRSASPLPPKPNMAPKPTPVHKVSASDVAEAADDADRHPSKMARKLGNYRKGHLSLHGLSLTIENAKNSFRGEKDKFGQKHGVKMPAAYGYIRGTLGADGMQVDCYIGKHPKSDKLWIIDQDVFNAAGDDKGFDEHKVMLGYNSPERAIRDYLRSHYDGLGHERLAAITEMTYAELKLWLRKGDMKRPVSEQGVGHVIGRRGDMGALTKGDTVSQSTGLLNYDYLRAPVPAKKRKRKKRSRGLASGPQWLSLAS